MTLRPAFEAYLDDCARRGLAKSTLNGKRSMGRKMLRGLGDVELGELTRERLREWMSGWRESSGARHTQHKHLTAFLAFCRGEGWIESSPIDGIKAPKIKRSPTQPLARREVEAMLSACNGGGERELLLLMRYSGLAISDAVTLRPDEVRDGAVVTRRNKTGTLVAVPLPALVADALRELPRTKGGYWWWSGKSEPVTAAKTWRERLKAVADRAGVEGFHPHRIRDTFAVELLLSGVAMEDVSRLLGHSSITTTEKFYAPWNRARLERLERVVRKAHGSDELLQGLA